MLCFKNGIESPSFTLILQKKDVELKMWQYSTH